MRDAGTRGLVDDVGPTPVVRGLIGLGVGLAVGILLALLLPRRRAPAQ